MESSINAVTPSESVKRARIVLSTIDELVTKLSVWRLVCYDTLIGIPTKTSTLQSVQYVQHLSYLEESTRIMEVCSAEMLNVEMDFRTKLREIEKKT